MSIEELVQYQETPDALKFMFLKRMDVQAAADFEPILKERLVSAAGKKMVFDLEKVDFIGSSFLRLCVMCAKESKGSLSIVNASPLVRKTLKIAGLEGFAKIV